MLTMKLFLFLFSILFIIMFYKMYIIHWSLMLFWYNIIIIIYMNEWINNFWYSYITFLIMVGGLMIIFLYFSSLGSNNIIYESKMFYFFLFMELFLIFIFFLLISLMKYYWIIFTFNNNSLSNFPMNFSYFPLNMSLKNFNLASIYSSPNWWITILSIMYLLITLIYIIKSTSSKKGSLMSKYYK